MMMTTWNVRIALLLALASVPLAGVPAAEEVLSYVPDNALGFVVVRNVAQTNDEIGGLMTRLEIPAPSPLAFLKSSVGLNAGVNFGGDLAVILVTEGDEGRVPIPVFVLPMMDFDAFVRSVNGVSSPDGLWQISLGGQTRVALRSGDYALIAEASGRSILKDLDGSRAKVSSKLDAIAPWTRQVDACAVAMPRGILMAQQAVLAQLTTFKQLLKQQLELQGQPSDQTIRGIEMYETLFAVADREVALIAAGLRIDEEANVHLLSRTVPTADGILSRLTTKVPLSGDDLFRGIPQGPFVFAASGEYPASMIDNMAEWLAPMMKTLFGPELTDEQAGELMELARESIRGLRGFSVVMSAAEDGQPLYGNVTMMMQVDEAANYLSRYRRGIEKMAQIGSETKNPLLAYDVSSFDIDGLQGLLLEMDMNAMMMNAAQPASVQEVQKSMMDAMFGQGGKLKIYMAAADETTIMATYVSHERLVKAIKERREGGASFSTMPNVTSVRSQLSSDAVMVGYWSMGGTIDFVRTTMSAVGGGVNVPIPPFPDTLPIGMSARTINGQIETDVVIPFELSDSLADYIRSTIAQPRPRQN